MKKVVLFLLFLSFAGYTAHAQQVTKISLPQLQQRISNTDTVYVVNFWATRCRPCAAELPDFDKLQA